MSNKVVYLLNHLEAGGGIQKVTVFKANALAQNGYNVIIAVTSRYKDSWVSEPVKNNVKIINLDINYRPPKYIFTNLKKLFAHKNSINRLLKEECPDFIISLGYWDRFFMPFIRRGKTKIIREIHYVSNYRLINNKKSLNHYLQFVKNYVEYYLIGSLWDRIILLTEYDYKNIWIGKKKNTCVIQNPVTIRPINSDLSKKVVVSVGRLAPQKNFQLLIRSFVLVHKKYPDWNLKIFGEGVLRNELEMMINNLGLSKCVFLSGVSTRIAEELSNASIYATSSIYEGFGLAVIEALSCGLPVVATRNVGAIEIIDGHNCGFLTALNDAKEMCDRICELIENQELMKNMHYAALKRAQDFSEHKVINQWMSLFEQMMA